MINRHKTSETSLQRKAVDKIQEVYRDIDNGVKRPKIARPFAVGLVDKEIKTYALVNNIDLGSGFMYMTFSKIKRAFRKSKPVEKRISRQDLANFPLSYHSMHIYYQNSSGSFIYTDYRNYFILSPIYSLNDRGSKRKLTLQISASKVVDSGNFKGNDYVRVR